MTIFNTTFMQMLMMLVLISAGFFIRKRKLVPDNTHTVLSKLETLIFLPALNFSTQLTQCTVETLRDNAFLILVGIPIVLIPAAISFPISHWLTKKNADKDLARYESNVYKYAISFANYGFVGNFIILGIWGNELYYKYSLFTFCFTLVCQSWGLYLLIPKKQGDSTPKSIRKALLSPPIVAMFLGMILGLAGAKNIMPSFLNTALDYASSCMGPVAMIIMGFVIGGFNIKGLITIKKSYLVTLLRLVIIPSLTLVVLKLLGASEELLILALVATATPIGLNTIIFPAAYGGEVKHGASLVTISQVLSVITLPLLYLVFIVLI